MPFHCHMSADSGPQSLLSPPSFIAEVKNVWNFYLHSFVFLLHGAWTVLLFMTS